MSQHKVPQDVEAEDKLLGPLSLRQLIYAVIALMWGAVMWQLFKSFIPLAVVMIAPVSGIFLALAFGRKEGQTFENYFIALVRFRVLPRKRHWMKDTSAVIVREETVKTKKIEMLERDPRQVRGQLQQLAFILETQGYVPKDPNISLPGANAEATQMSQRIISPPVPQPVAVPTPMHAMPEDITAPINAPSAPATTAAVPTVADITSTAPVVGNTASPTPPTATAVQPPVSAPPIDVVTAKDDMLDLSVSDRAVTVGEILENVETSIRAQALSQMHQAATAKPATHPHKSAEIKQAEQKSHQPAVQNVAQNDIMTVSQIAAKVNQPQVIAEGQTVQVGAK